MNEIILKEIAKDYGITYDTILKADGKVQVTDGFTYITVGIDDTVCTLPKTFKVFYEARYKSFKSGKWKPTTPLEITLCKQFKECSQQPEIDILEKSEYGEYYAVVYTDTMMACLGNL